MPSQWANEAARFHGRRGMALGIEALAADIELVCCRGGESAAASPSTAVYVARRLVPISSNSKDGCRGRSGVDAGRQSLDLENDQLKRILGNRGGFSDNNSDGFTDVAHLAVAITGCS